MTIPRFLAAKKNGRKLTMLTAYDFLTAGLFDEAGVDSLLVGDSLGMVVQGHESTLPVTLEQIIYHAEIVARATKYALVIADMPFMTFQESPMLAIRNAGRILKETGVGAVKLEGGVNHAKTIEALTNCDLPVMAHIGMKPQSIRKMGTMAKIARDEKHSADYAAEAVIAADTGFPCKGAVFREPVYPLALLGIIGGRGMLDIITRFDADHRRIVGKVSGNQGAETDLKAKQTSELVLPDNGWADIKQALQHSLSVGSAIISATSSSSPAPITASFTASRCASRNTRSAASSTGISTAIRRKIRPLPGRPVVFQRCGRRRGHRVRGPEGRHTLRWGRLAFFPVAWTYRHRGAPPASGPKYVCTTFVHPRFLGGGRNRHSKEAFTSMDIRDDVVEAIGNTPLIRLTRPRRRPAARFWARPSSSTPASR